MKRSWALFDDRGRCLETGAVEAESDAAAVQEVLAGAAGRLANGGGTDPKRWYRVKCGSAVASAAGDEFASVGGSIGADQDAAGEAARRAVEAARKAAEDGFRKALADKLEARRAQKALDGQIKASTPTTAGGMQDFLKHFAGEIFKSAKSAEDAYERLRKVDPIPPPANPTGGA